MTEMWNELPRKTENGREVSLFVQVASRIDVSSSIDETEGMICYPWYSQSHPQKCAEVWKRDSVENGWVSFEEYHGESPLSI